MSLLHREFKPITLLVEGQFVLVKPRLEAIVFPVTFTDTVSYELLCRPLGYSSLETEIFFQRLSLIDLMYLYQQSLNQLPASFSGSLTLNICSKLLKNKCFFALLSQYPRVKFNLELSERESAALCLKELSAAIARYPQQSITLWLDDFGSQCANFDRICHHRFDGIKIAKELFWSLFDMDQDLLIKIILFLKKKCDLVIIEGVDSKARFEFAMANQCAAQGHYLRNNQEIQLTA